MKDGVIVQDSAGRIIRFNASALRILGMSADQLLGKTSLDPGWTVVTEDLVPCPGVDHPAYLALTTGVRQSGRVLGMKLTSERMTWVAVDATPIFRDGDTNPFEVVVTFTDITKDREARAEIEEQRHFLRFMADNIPGVFAYWSDALECKFSNKVYLEWFGKTQEQMAGIRMDVLLGPELFAANEVYVKGALAGKAQSFERTFVKFDGTSRFMWVQYVPDIQDGKVKGFFAMVSDITDLRVAQDEMIVERAKMFAASKLSTLGEMAGGMAHEINNPLAIIIGRANSLIRKLAVPGSQDRAIVTGIHDILDTANRIASVVRGLTSFARNAAEDPMQPSSIETIVKDTISLCRERFKGFDVTLRVQVDGDAHVNCRAVEISQVLMNLLANAFDATLPLAEKWVVVAIRSHEAKVEVSVTDSGLGIDPAIADKIMNPFFTTKDIGSGTGLGLSMATGIIKAHGGTLSLDASSPNTRLIFVLPRWQEKSPPDML